MKRILLNLIVLLTFSTLSISVSAQQTIYANGNVSIIQNPDGWQMLHGKTIVGHGEGVLDIDNVSPAFRSILDYYSTLKLKETPVRKSASKGTSVTYGPLLNTAWKQSAPCNGECPIMTLSGNGNEFTKQTITGCSSISSAQLMNYFGYCNPLVLSGSNNVKNYSNLISVSSPYFTSTNGCQYTYSYNYTPDFEKISNNDSEIAKYIVGVAFAQKAAFGVDGTSTFVSDQNAALKNIFGYTVDFFSYIDDLASGSRIENAIKKGWPTMVSGSDLEDNGHSFIVDGYNDGEFHVDFGWGGLENGWFLGTKYSEGIVLIVAHPNVSNATYMQQTPKYLIINGVDNNERRTILMEQHGDNVLQYKQKGNVTLDAGEYEFYFEYEDGSKLAPYTTKDIILNQDNPVYKKYGNYVTTPARFSISKEYCLDFYHNLGKGEVRVELNDAFITISGKVLDSGNNPVEGATVTTANSIPVPEIDAQNSGDFNYGYAVNNTSIGFIPSKKFLTKFGVYIWLKNNPTSNLTVSLIDDSKNVLWTGSYEKSKFATYSKFLEVEFDKPIAVSPNQKYYILLTAANVSDNYYVCGATSESNYVFKVWGVDDYYVKTGTNGIYEYFVPKHSNGTLHAYHNTKTFNSITYRYIQSPKTGVNFKEGAGNITIEDYYAIKYIVDSEVYMTVNNVSVGATIPAIVAPQKTGYSVREWTPALPSTMPAKNLTVTAQWQINSYTISFNTDGGSSVASITQNYGTAITKPQDPTKEWCNFIGWDRAIPTTMPAENLTIRALWKALPIPFADPTVEAICVAKWDTDGDGELSYIEAAAVKSLDKVFKENVEIASFDELQYFTGLTSISNTAFSGCSALASVTIPNSVTRIGRDAFAMCSSLTGIKVESGNIYYTSENGVLFNKDKTVIVCFPAGKSERTYTIPDGIIKIEYGAFSGCTSLTSVTIPNSVTGIGGQAFYSCTNLTSMIIIGNLTNIGAEAFYYCSNLKSICYEGREQPEFDSPFGGFNVIFSNITVCVPVDYTSRSWCGIRNIYKGHDFLPDEEIPATCTASGLSEGVHCSRCGKIITAQEVIPALGHTEVTDAAVAATCTATGLTAGKHCSVCNAILVAQQTVPAKGHTEVTDAAVAATCTATGLTAGKHCSVCNTVLVAQQTVPAKGHTEVTDAAVAATCTATGLTAGKHCSVCNTVLVAQQTVPAKGHKEVTDAAVAATCTESGLTAGKHCSVCNSVLVAQQTVPAKGHKEVTDAAVAATCTESGLTAGKHCSVCNAILVAQQTIPAKGHTEVTDAAVAATCTATGLTAGKHCSVCNTVLVAQQTVPAKGHKEVTDAAVAATCTATGLTAGKHCSVCNAILVAQQTVPAKGHKEVTDAAVAATCTESGMTAGKHCSVCNAILVAQQTVPAKGHKEVTDAAVAATCTESGLTAGKHCSVCNAILVAQQTVPARGHKEVTDAAVAATCTATGLTAGKHCSVCNAILVAQQTIPAKGHTEVTDAAVAATCTATGLTAGKHCSVCNAILVAQQTVPARGHKEVTDAAVAATCTESGLTAGKHCSVCNAILVAQQTVPARGHKEVTDAAVAATCTATGLTAGKHCSVCNAILVAQQTVPAKGHKEVTDAAVAATCTESGLTAGKHCSVCNAILVAQQTIPAKGHTEVTDAAVAATCTATGLTAGKHCSVCGEVFVAQEVIPAIGHEFMYYIYNNDATTIADGTETATCSRCSATDTHVVEGTKLFDVTSVADSAANAVNIYANGNTIVIENAAEDIFVYDAMGRLVCKKVACSIRTELHIIVTGVYIVKTGCTVKRVFVN